MPKKDWQKLTLGPKTWKNGPIKSRSDLAIKRGKSKKKDCKKTGKSKLPVFKSQLTGNKPSKVWQRAKNKTSKLQWKSTPKSEGLSQKKLKNWPKKQCAELSKMRSHEKSYFNIYRGRKVKIDFEVATQSISRPKHSPRCLRRPPGIRAIVRCKH